ncbi:TPA: DMT family transporter, partial [Thermoplasmata archaeon]|nr:DMT family transporter [Thermoplasmata archaeon]
VITFYRLFIACAILLPSLWWTRGFSELRTLSTRDWSLILLSATALAFHFGLWIASLGLTLVATSVVLVTAHPLFVAGASHFVLGERVKRIAAVGIVVAFLGVCVISFADAEAGGTNLYGNLLALLGGICAGVYFLSGRIARQTISLGSYVFTVYLIAATMLFVGALLVGDEMVVSSQRELTLFLLLAIVPTILGHTMFNYALKAVPAHVVSTSLLAEPIGASVLAYFLLPDEVPGKWIIVGSVFVIGGLYAVLMTSRRRGNPSS